MDSIISESCDIETILQKNYRKMTILWPFSYNSFVKFHDKRPFVEHIVSRIIE